MEAQKCWMCGEPRKLDKNAKILPCVNGCSTTTAQLSHGNTGYQTKDDFGRTTSNFRKVPTCKD